MKFEFNRPSGFRESVWKCWRTTDGQGQGSHWYTISSPMSLQLRWTKNAYHLCSSWGSNQGHQVWNQPLYHITIKAGLYSKAIPTRYSPSIFRSVLESQSEFQRPYIPDMNVFFLSHRMGHLRWAPNVTGENTNHLCPVWGSNLGRWVRNQTL